MIDSFGSADRTRPALLTRRYNRRALIGRRLSHYQITAKIGAGGMGEVYRAEDTKLEREMAFKVLPEEMASDRTRLSRFQREAKTVAALNHPNIVTIFSVEEADGIHFLTMELVAGKAIGELIPAGGLSLDRFLDLATPIADAVASAHARGIVHRDLKPANVMVTDEGDRVKVLDFGLAKLNLAAGADGTSQMMTQTQEGLILGTPCYMSPEQARGGEVDHRSDIFSLGMMFFEMATGARPFEGANAIELVSAVLKDPAPALSDIRPQLPRHLGRVIGRCLEKAPDDRYQTARDVFNELRAIRAEETSAPLPAAAVKRTKTGPTAGDQRVFSISVLPIDCDSGNLELLALARGLAEDIAGGLAVFRHLSVNELAPDNVEGGPDSDVRDTARRLGARYLLTGSLRKVGETVRLGVRLVDALEGERLWAETYDRPSSEMSRIETQDRLRDSIVATVADGAGVLVRSIAQRLRLVPAEEMRASDWIVSFYDYVDQLQPHTHAELRAGLEQAVELHPKESAIWACLAQVYLDEHRAGFNPRKGSLDRALDAAQRAIALDPRSSLAQESLADTHFFLRDMTAFRLAAEKALALNPRDATTQASIGMWLALSGELERGCEISRRAMELNPHHPGWYHFAPFFYHYEREEYEEALAAATSMGMPQFFWDPMMRAAAAGQMGRSAEARAATQKLEVLLPGTARRVREEAAKFIVPERLREHFLEGLAKAGIAIAGGGQRAAEAAVLASARAPGLERRESAFVGRDAERAKLDDMLSNAAAGRGALVLLGGEPGVGKTRLATEILEDGRELGMLALTGHAYEDQTAPFIISTEILEEMVRLVPEGDLGTMLGNNASELSRFLPELRQIYPDIPEPAELPAELQQRHLFKSVLEFLTRGSSAQPMVMLFDDLHWADESSLLLLEHIAPRLGELPMLMIGTYRDVEADIGKPFARSLVTLVRQRLAERISVDPFDETSVADILTALGGSHPPEGLAHAIHEATEGNVFFIEETFRHLSEEGLLFAEDDGWRADIDVEHLDVPEGVRLVTARRLERLSESTRKVLAMAAMIGLRFSIPVLEAAYADAEAVLDAVEEAESAHLLQPATGGRELRYEFVHALARQTLLGDLSRLRQQRMHLVIADAIEQTATGQAERWAADLAHHLLEAGSSADPARTVGWLKAAGDNAFAAAAMEEAERYFDTALSLVGDEDKEIRANLLRRRGAARRSLGQLEDFLADLLAAFDLFEALGLGEKAAPIADDLATILTWLARPGEAQVLISRGLALVPDDQSVSRCRLLSAQGTAFSNGGDAAASMRAHQAAIAIARRLDSSELLARVLQNKGWDGWHRFDGVAAERVAHEAAAIHRGLGQEWNLSQSLVVEQAGLTLTGRYDEAERINDELLPIAQRHEDLGPLGVSAMMNGLIQQARGNIVESSRHIRRSTDLFDTGGLPWSPVMLSSYSVNALLIGEFDQARTAFESAAAKGAPAGTWSGADVGMVLSGKARLGDPDTYDFFESLRDEVPAEGQVMASGSVLLLLATIEALVLLGRDDEAALHYPTVRAFVASGGGVQTFTYGLTERFAGMAAAAARNWDAAEKHFAKALDLAETLPHRVDQARVRYWFARALLDRNGPGDRDRAQQILTEARALSESMGLHGQTQWIDAQLAR